MKSENNIILYNGKIYTSNPSAPWAEAVAIRNGRFIQVGSNNEVKSTAQNGKDWKLIDLSGKTVLPGLLDGHTHPITVAKTYWHVTIPWTYDKDELLQNLKRCAAENPKDKKPYFYCESYMTEIFGDKGPDRKLLDDIISDRPARIQDFSDHACWYNSIALEMLSDENGIPNIPTAIGGAEFKKDESGRYTGHCLEATPDSDEKIFAALNWFPQQKITEEMVAPFLNMLKANGIMGLMDGFTEGEESIKLFYDMDKAGRLEMYYEAASILPDISDLENSIKQVRDWQKKYTTEHIRCNVIKFFADGVNDHGDCLSTEPFHNDPTGQNYGQAYCTAEELQDVIIRLNEEGIDLHIHAVCDGTFRMICDAVESAQKICTDKYGCKSSHGLRIRITMAHCELIHPDDIPRAGELGIYIDSTPHWSGGYSDEGVQAYHGKERWGTMFDFTKVIASGGKVGFSSDVFNYNEARRASPFLGMQVGMTRIDPDLPLDSQKYPGGVHPPYDAKLSLEQLINGYTAVNAERMRLDHIMGSIECGKLANLIVLADDIFALPAEEIGKIKIDSVYFEGKKRS